MSGSTTNAALHDDAGNGTSMVEQTQIASDRMLNAIGKIEHEIDEKISRDSDAKNTPDPAIAEMSAEIDGLKAELASLQAENTQLRQAVNNAGDRLDNAIETLSSTLHEAQ